MEESLSMSSNIVDQYERVTGPEYRYNDNIFYNDIAISESHYDEFYSLATDILDQNDDVITYKNDHPVLTYLSGFSEAFMKARELNFENFWFNGDLYHTKLKEDLDIKEGNHISSDMPDKQTTVSQNP